MGYSKEAGHEVAETTTAPDQSPTPEVDMAPSKRTTSPAFQLYAAEFLAGDKVSRMSYAEIGIFTVLLCHAWTGNGLHTDIAEIAKKLKLNPKQFARIWDGVLHECWVERNGRLVNQRQEVERKKQRDYRDKQRNAAASRWDKPGTPQAMPRRHASGTTSGNALQSSSSSSSEVRTQRQGGAPIHTSHKSHVACGRICVPAALHDHFVRARNHDGADKELRDWYLAVDVEWQTGAHKNTNPGGNDFAFWRARFDEQWPAAVKAAPRRRAEQQPEYHEWTCPHVEEHVSKFYCDQATALNRPRKMAMAGKRE